VAPLSAKLAVRPRISRSDQLDGLIDAPAEASAHVGDTVRTRPVFRASRVASSDSGHKWAYVPNFVPTDRVALGVGETPAHLVNAAGEALVADDVCGLIEALPPRFRENAKWQMELSTRNFIHRLHILDRMGTSVYFLPPGVLSNTASNLPNGRVGRFAAWRTGAEPLSISAFRMLDVSHDRLIHVERTRVLMTLGVMRRRLSDPPMANSPASGLRDGWGCCAPDL
jgi:predicted phage gp36 major capsid-like protein